MSRGGDALCEMLGVAAATNTAVFGSKGQKTHFCPYRYGGGEEETEIQTWFNLLFQFTTSPLHSPPHLSIEQTMAAISAKSSPAPSSGEIRVPGYVIDEHRAKNPIQRHLFTEPPPSTSRSFTNENGHIS